MSTVKNPNPIKAIRTPKATQAQKVPRAAPKRKKPKKKQSKLPFWIGLGVLAGIGLLVLYVEFFTEKKQPIWPEGHSPLGNTILGIDVSKYQRKIDWEKVRNNDVSFAFIKATEGVKLKDSHFERNWEQTQQAGIIRGAYHFYRPNVAPGEQARNFIETVALQPGDLPPVLDIEVRGRQPLNHLRGDLKEWLVLVERAYGVKPIIYTGYSFYKDYLEGYFDEYPLWIAHYNVKELQMQRTERALLSFWQHTDRGAIDGIKGPVDCNIFYGSKKEIRKLCLPSAVTPKTGKAQL